MWRAIRLGLALGAAMIAASGVARAQTYTLTASGIIDQGTDYQDVFGLGSGVNLSGIAFTMTFGFAGTGTYGSTLVHIPPPFDLNADAGDYFNSGPGIVGSTSVTINGVTVVSQLTNNGDQNSISMFDYLHVANETTSNLCYPQSCFDEIYSAIDGSTSDGSEVSGVLSLVSYNTDFLDGPSLLQNFSTTVDQTNFSDTYEFSITDPTNSLAVHFTDDLTQLTYTSAPEPTTLAVFGTAIVGLGASRRRRAG